MVQKHAETTTHWSYHPAQHVLCIIEDWSLRDWPL